ncbi:MAG: hypothetical protein WDO71_05095 [Bacteroidota bacterium]
MPDNCNVAFDKAGLGYITVFKDVALIAVFAFDVLDITNFPVSSFTTPAYSSHPYL